MMTKRDLEEALQELRMLATVNYPESRKWARIVANVFPDLVKVAEDASALADYRVKWFDMRYEDRARRLRASLRDLLPKQDREAQ